MAIEKYAPRLQAINDKIVVRPTQAEESKTESGIVLAGAPKDVPGQGEVLSVGEGRWEGALLVPLKPRLGDTVVYRKGAGQYVQFNGERLLVMREDEVFGIIEP
jgi:chaperonin GroES